MKTKELRAYCLELARGASFGKTTPDPLTGERWAATEVFYERVVDANEQGERKITLEEFQRGLRGLQLEQLFEFTDEAAGLGNVCMPAIFGGVVSPNSEVKPMFDIAKATVPEILKKYNELNPATPVKRFADRKTAERRLRAAIKKADAPAPAAPKAEKAAKAPRAAKAPKAPKAANTDQRYVRHHVSVAGTEYRSVAEAFKALNLPMSKHIKFRGELKGAADGKATFKHDDKSYNFRVVQAA